MMHWFSQLIKNNNILSVSAMLDGLPGADTITFKAKDIESELKIKLPAEISSKVNQLINAYKKSDASKAKKIVSELESGSINVVKKSKRLTALKNALAKHK